jgi:hypothetical protein
MSLMILLFLLVHIPGSAHQTHGWKHATGTIGPAISGRYCSDMTQVWEIDKDEDGVMDECVNLLFTHERIHVKKIVIINDKCECP